jgi:hypothetical protein
MKKPWSARYAKTSSDKKICGGISAKPNIPDASLGLLVVLTDANCAVAAPILHSAR